MLSRIKTVISFFRRRVELRAAGYRLTWGGLVTAEPRARKLPRPRPVNLERVEPVTPGAHTAYRVGSDGPLIELLARRSEVTR